MRQLVSRILLILSIINFTLAAPVLVQEIHDQAHVHVAGVPKDAIPALSESEKRVDLLEKPQNKYSDESWRKRGLSSESSPALSDLEEPDNWHEWAIRMYPPPAPPLPPPPPPTWQAQIAQQISSAQQASSSSSDASDRGSTTATGNKYQALPSNKGPGGSGPSGSRYPEDGYESTGSNVPGEVPEVKSKPPKNPVSKFVSKSMSSLGKLFGKLKLKPRRHTGTSDSISQQ